MSEHEKAMLVTIGLGAIAVVVGLTLYNYLGKVPTVAKLMGE